MVGYWPFSFKASFCKNSAVLISQYLYLNSKRKKKKKSAQPMQQISFSSTILQIELLVKVGYTVQGVLTCFFISTVLHHIMYSACEEKWRFPET